MAARKKKSSDRLPQIVVSDTPPNLGPGSYFTGSWKPDTIFLKRMLNPALLKKVAATPTTETRAPQAHTSDSDDTRDRKSATETADPETAATAALKKLLLSGSERLICDGQLFGALQLRVFAESVVQSQVAVRHAVRVEVTNQALRSGRTLLHAIGILATGLTNLRCLDFSHQNTQLKPRERAAHASTLFADIVRAVEGTAINALVLEDLGLTLEGASADTMGVLLKRCTNITSLHIGCNPIEVGAFPAAVAHLQPSQLRELSLRRVTSINSATMLLFGTILAKNTSLTSLDLTGCQLGREECDAFFGEMLVDNDTLTELNLSDCPRIQDDLVPLLAEIIVIHPLKALHVSGCGISATGAAQLQHAQTKSKTLQILNLPS